jgi:hypothetical protein
VNYVIYGVMCKLCYDHYSKTIAEQNAAKDEDIGAGAGSRSRSVISESMRDDFSKSGMLDFINRYKGSTIYTGWHASANLDASKAWALVGYNGWPGNKGSAPTGDRSNCSPTCPDAYGSLTKPGSPKGPFQVHWYPFLQKETVERYAR